MRISTKRAVVRLTQFVVVVSAAMCLVRAGGLTDSENAQLEVRLTMSKAVFTSNEPVECEIEIENVGLSNVRILNKFRFPNYYIRFKILDERGHIVTFRGKLWEAAPQESWFVTLEPASWIGVRMQLYNPNHRIAGQGGQYNLSESGLYSIEAVYTGCEECGLDRFGLTAVASNCAKFEIRDRGPENARDDGAPR